MDSVRFPGKVLMHVDGTPLLGRILGALQGIDQSATIVVATASDSVNIPIQELATEYGVATFFGPKNNVALRFLLAAQEQSADMVVRLTADNPFIDRGLLQKAVQLAERESSSQARFIVSTRGSGLPEGLDVEVFDVPALTEVCQWGDTYDLEHVCPWMYRNLPVLRLTQRGSLSHQHRTRPPRLTVDYPEDLKRASDFAQWLAGRAPTAELAFQWAVARQVPPQQSQQQNLGRGVDCALSSHHQFQLRKVSWTLR